MEWWQWFLVFSLGPVLWISINLSLGMLGYFIVNNEWLGKK